MLSFNTSKNTFCLLIEKVVENQFQWMTYIPKKSLIHIKLIKLLVKKIMLAFNKFKSTLIEK